MNPGSNPLPAAIPLFPLPNAVLFPGVPMPLHIFEPRYRDMVRDAHDGGDGVIGMVLLRGDWRESYHQRPEIFQVGCAGRMVRCDALADGRYNIVLHGMREFRVRAEIQDESTYRRAEVTWRDPPADGLSADERARVRTAMVRYIEPRDPELAQRLLDEASMSDEVLVNFLCQSLDFPPMDRQSLLESAAICNRAARLCEVIEFALGSGGFGGSESVH